MGNPTNGLIGQNSSQPIPEDTMPIRMARQLADAIRRKRLDRNPINVMKWAADFELVLKRHGSAEVEETLAWYIDNVGGKFVPEAYSAEGFRKKYDAIRRQMDERPFDSVVLSADAQTILRNLEGMSWPAGVDVHLPRLVERSLQAYTPFWERVKAFYGQYEALAERSPDPKRARAIRRLGEFVGHLREAYILCKPVDFVEDWLRRLNDILSRWRDWGGNAGSLAFTEESPWLRKFGREWSHDYFESSFEWDDLVKEVKDVPTGSSA
jgi:hypothetical protein